MLFCSPTIFRKISPLHHHQSLRSKFMTMIPAPPACPKKLGPVLECHGVKIDRPYDWLKNIKTDPDVEKYLKSEEKYCKKLFSSDITATRNNKNSASSSSVGGILTSLKKTICTELEDRSTGGDAQIPTLLNGYYYYETDTEPACPLSSKKANKHLLATTFTTISSTPPTAKKKTSNKKNNKQHQQPSFPSSLSRSSSAPNNNNDDDDDAEEYLSWSTCSSRSSSRSGSDDDDDKKLICYRVPATTSSSSNTNNNNNNKSLVDIFSEKFLKKPDAEILQHPRNTEIYLDLNFISEKLDRFYKKEGKALREVISQESDDAKISSAHHHHQVNHKHHHNKKTKKKSASTKTSSSSVVHDPAEYCEQEDMMISPDNRSVVCSVDTTPGSEQYTVLAVDCSTQKLLCAVGLGTKKKSLSSSTTAATAGVSSSPSASASTNKNNGNNSLLLLPRNYQQVSSFSESLGCFYLDDIPVCSDSTVWLDDNTFAFTEIDDPSTMRGVRVWAVYLERGNNNNNNNNKSAASTTISSCHCYLLYEEEDSCFEVNSVFLTTDKKYAVIDAGTSDCNSSVVVDLSEKIQPNKEDNFYFFKARPFCERVPSRSFSLDHDPRPLEFFLNTFKQQSSKKAAGDDDDGNTINNNNSGVGTWFVVHNLHNDGSIFKVDICSCSNENLGKNNTHDSWITLLAPPLPSNVSQKDVDSILTANNNKNIEQETQNNSNSNTIIDLRDCTFVEEVGCYKNFIIFTVRRGGFQNLLFYDFLCGHQQSKKLNHHRNDKNSSSSSSSLLELSDLVNVHEVCFNNNSKDNKKNQNNKTIVPNFNHGHENESITWLDLELDCDYDTESIRFDAHHIVVPERTFALEFDHKTSSWYSRLLLVDKQNCYNPNKYAVDIHHVPVPLHPYPSSDNNKSNNNQLMIAIPLLVIYRRDKFSPGQNPLRLSAYGSYGSSYDAEFSPGRISLLNRGIVEAFAMVRGGGEYGEVWRRGGSRENRPCTFSDFIECAKYCHPDERKKSIITNVTSNTSFSFSLSNGNICCYGESAGGSIIGYAINTRPDLFVGAVARVPFVNCLDSLLDENLPLTKSEWADWMNPAESRENFDLIRSYSPIDNMISCEKLEEMCCGTTSPLDNNNLNDDEDDKENKRKQNTNNSNTKNKKSQSKQKKSKEDSDDFESILKEYKNSEGGAAKNNKLKNGSSSVNTKETKSSSNNSSTSNENKKQSLDHNKEKEKVSRTCTEVHHHNAASSLTTNDDNQHQLLLSRQQFFPSIYVESGLHDARVKYYEGGIWVAMLRERMAVLKHAFENQNHRQKKPKEGRDSLVIHKINFSGGHDGDADADEDDELAHELAFIVYVLGIKK